MKKVMIWVLVILFVLITLLDLGLNFIAVLVPSLGTIAETFTEGVLELFQTVIFGIMVFLGLKTGD